MISNSKHPILPIPPPEGGTVPGQNDTKRGQRGELYCINCLHDNIVPSFPSNLIVLDRDLKGVSASRSLYNMFNITPRDIIGKALDEILGGIGVLKEYIYAISPGNAVKDLQCECNSPKKGKMVLNLSLASIRLTAEQIEEWLLSIEDITERRQAEETILHLAYYDLLTGLPNRTLLHDRLQKAFYTARLENRSLALLVMDLDRFKEVNNTLGHQNGDLLLQQIGRRLRDNFQGADLIARLGGDEFSVLLKDKDSEATIQAAAELIKIFEEPFYLEELSISVSASIGIALFPGHGEDADTLIRHADIAMHTAKETESVFCLYSSQHDQYSPGRLALMGELRSAIEENQLFLVYQPKTELVSGITIGVEALVRWQHPKLGIIPPDQFIALAEYTGLIKPLTFWVLKEALRQSRAWHEAGLDISIAVNLSVRSLQSSQLLDQIKELLSRWGILPSRLRLEITESIIMSDPGRAMEIITHLTKMCIGFSIDDFGTGYSSLSYLQKLPVDEIKIDRSFVINMLADSNSAMIVRTIIELGHNLGLMVSAEGVENQETLDRLISLGCDYAQGYFIGRPVGQEELTKWLCKQGA